MTLQYLPSEGWLNPPCLTSCRESTRLYIFNHRDSYSRLQSLLTSARFKRVQKVRQSSYRESRRRATAQYRAQLSPETLAQLDSIRRLRGMVQLETIDDMQYSEMCRLAGLPTAAKVDDWNTVYATFDDAKRVIIAQFRKELNGE